MRADVKAELQMLRELVWFAYGIELTNNTEAGKGINKFCYFCHEPLLILPSDITFGHRRHPRVGVDLTLHHIDENRENNAKENLASCHDSCHRRWHAAKRAAVRKEIISRVQRESDAKHA